MKKKLFLAALVVIVLASIGLGTFAAYTTAARSRNVITTGKIDISIVEQQADGGAASYSGTPIPVMPASTVSKVVSVRCNEEQAYVRMKYTIAFRDAQGNDLALDPAVVEITPTGQNWIESDGWFYYNVPLSAGEITEPLFESVSFSGLSMGNEYQNATVVVRIHAQSVQTANNPIPADGIPAVHGWPIF